MTWILSLLVLASIAAMAWAFLSAAKLEASVDALETRINERLAHNPVHETETVEKGKAKAK
ncbi:MAG: hypothetical protein AAB214_10590 [Fibrobacterota bacterium]